MSKVNLEDAFFDIMSVVIQFVDESSHIELYTELLQEMKSKEYDIKDLYGHDETVDDAFDEISDELDDYEDEF